MEASLRTIGLVCFSTMIVPSSGSLVFLNVQVTVSPAARSTAFGGLDPSRSRSQLPAFWHVFGDGVRPGVELVERLGLAVRKCEPVLPELEVELGLVATGLGDLLDDDRAGLGKLRFVNVHVTVELAGRSISSGSLPLSHVADSSSQPSGTLSVTEYGPGRSGSATFCSDRRSA